MCQELYQRRYVSVKQKIFPFYIWGTWCLETLHELSCLTLPVGEGNGTGNISITPQRGIPLVRKEPEELRTYGIPILPCPFTQKGQLYCTLLPADTQKRKQNLFIWQKKKFCLPLSMIFISPSAGHFTAQLLLLCRDVGVYRKQCQDSRWTLLWTVSWSHLEICIWKQGSWGIESGPAILQARKMLTA